MATVKKPPGKIEDFYSVQRRKSVTVDKKDIKKKVYVRETSKGKQERYALRAMYEGSSLTKFVSKAVYDSMDVPVEK
jgi:hypothetical protein